MVETMQLVIDGALVYGAVFKAWVKLFMDNKAGYTAQDAPSTRLKITGDGRTDTTSYRDATAHLKIEEKPILFLFSFLWVLIVFTAYFF